MRFPPPTESQAKVIWVAVTGLSVALLAALVVGLIWTLLEVVRVLAPVLWPLAVAGVIAYLLDPVVDFLERKGVPRARAILCVFALALMIIGALFSSVVPRIVSETRDLVSRVPAYAVQVQSRLEKWATEPPDILRKFLGPFFGPATNDVISTNLPPGTVTNALAPAESPVGPPAPPANAPSATNAVAGPAGESMVPAGNWLTSTFDFGSLQSATGAAAKLLPKIGSWLFGQVNRVASWFGVLAALALVPVYTFYFLFEKRRISSHWTDYLPVTDSAFKNELVFILDSINNYLIAFFRGQVLVAICDGILYGIGFMIVGVPYAALIGAAAVFLTIIPFIGAIIVCVSAVLISLIQHGDWLHPLLALGVVGVVQALEGLVISPKIMGDRVGLHPVTIIIAVMLGTTVMGGLLGGILAIPLTAALRVLMFRYIWKRRMAQAGAAPVTPSASEAGPETSPG